MSVETATWILSALFLIAGIVSLSAAIANWDWFFTSYNVEIFMSRIKRPYARIFYGVIGLAIISMAIAISPIFN